MMPLRLTVDFRMDTPMFLGATDADSESVMRAPPWKAALRFWMRTLMAPSLSDWQVKEREWCGSHPVVGDGSDSGSANDAADTAGADMPDWRPRKSPWRLQIRGWGAFKSDFDFDDRHYNPLQVQIQAKNGQPASFIKGLPWLWFSLPMKGNQGRTAIDMGKTVSLTLTVVEPEVLGAEGRRALLGAVWLLGHLGSMGTRASRGAGSISLTKWQVRGFGDTALTEWEEDMAALGLCDGAADDAAWVSAFNASMAMFTRWFPANGSRPATPCLGPNASAILLPEGRPRDLALSRRNSGFEPWELALDGAGARLQWFRRRDRRSRDQILFQLLQDVGHGDGRPLKVLPKRAQFGLPLTFRFAMRPSRYKAALDGVQMDVTPDRPKSERHASLLRVRVVNVGGTARALLVRLDGALPGDAIQKGANGQYPGAFKTKASIAGGLMNDINVAPVNLLDAFLGEVARERGATSMRMGGER